MEAAEDEDRWRQSGGMPYSWTCMWRGSVTEAAAIVIAPAELVKQPKSRKQWSFHFSVLWFNMIWRNKNNRGEGRRKKEISNLDLMKHEVFLKP